MKHRKKRLRLKKSGKRQATRMQSDHLHLLGSLLKKIEDKTKTNKKKICIKHESGKCHIKKQRAKANAASIKDPIRNKS
jgi:hypothetical protein